MRLPPPRQLIRSRPPPLRLLNDPPRGAGVPPLWRSSCCRIRTRLSPPRRRSTA